MIKSEVIATISHRTGISKADVRLTIEVLFQVIQQAVVVHGKVDFRGFGSFVAKKRRRKIARNITQNTALIIDEHHVPSFNPAKAFVAHIKAQFKDID